MSPPSVFDRFDPPPIAVLLGWRLLDADADQQTVKVAFNGRPEFCNPAGFIQGGMLAAMLDDTLGPAVLVASKGALFTSTITLNVNYLSPARPGEITGHGKVLLLGKTVAFMEAKLVDGEGKVLATATASARCVPTERLPGA